MQSEIDEYIAIKRKTYEYLIEYIKDEDSTEDNFDPLITYIQSQNLKENPNEFEHLLQLILSISNNYHRYPKFFTKIEKILLSLKDDIKQTFTDSAIFDIFVSNKLVLLFLIDEKILVLNDEIFYKIVSKFDANGTRYCHYFYPEIESYANEHEHIQMRPDYIPDESKFENFEEKRRKGENDTYISQLIRQDSIEKFSSHMTSLNISFSCHIAPSLFETNLFLTEKNPTLIEYASFYGSIEIFQYLMFNGAKIEPTIWLYSIHSNNSNFLIHQIQTNVKFELEFFPSILNEAIKCHSKEFADFVIDMSNDQNVLNSEICISGIFENHNYYYFPKKFDQDFMFFPLFKYNYSYIINFLLKSLNNKIKGQNAILDPKNLNGISNFNFNKSSIYEALKGNLTQIVYFLLLEKDSIASGIHDITGIPRKTVIPNSILSIEPSIFSGYNISQIILPTSLKTIGKSAFAKCKNLIEIEIPNSVTIIDDNAFKECSSLQRILIPSSVTKLGVSVFNECISLENATIFASISEIPYHSFYNCSSLTNVVVFSSIKSIGSNAFTDCDSLINVSLPSTVEKISSYAFYNCSSLEKMLIPNSVKVIGNLAFSKCYSLKFLVIPSVIELGGYVFSDCSSLEEVKIPSSVKNVGNFIFSGCTSMQNVLIPKNLKIRFSGLNSDIFNEYDA